MSEDAPHKIATLTLDMMQALPAAPSSAETVLDVPETPIPEANGHAKGGRRLKATKAQTADVIERVRLYLLECEPGIQGQYGSKATLWACRVAVYGFDLGEEAGYGVVAEHYNPRCVPPWPEDQLRRKCAEANKDDFHKPRGWLRDTWKPGMAVDQVTRRADGKPNEPIPPGERVTMPASGVTTRKVEWLWFRRLPLGKLITLAGLMGIGKTFLLCDIAARISAGKSWPDCPTTFIEPGDVLFISGEDDPEDTLVPRLIECEADLSRVRFLTLQALDQFDLHNRDLLDRAYSECRNLKLIVIDPPSSYLGDVDDHKNAELRRLLTPLKIWTAKYNVAMIFNTHLNKGGAGKVEAIYRVIGSVAWMAAVRAGHLVALDADDPEKRLFVPMKSNLGKKPPALAYTIKETANELARVEWLGEIDITADQAVNRENKKKKRRVVASEWLETLFLPNVSQLPSNDIWTRMRAETSLSDDALKEAKEDMGIKARRLCDDAGVVMWFWIWNPEDRDNWQRKKARRDAELNQDQEQAF